VHNLAILREIERQKLGAFVIPSAASAAGGRSTTCGHFSGSISCSSNRTACRRGLCGASADFGHRPSDAADARHLLRASSFADKRCPRRLRQISGAKRNCARELVLTRFTRRCYRTNFARCDLNNVARSKICLLQSSILTSPSCHLKVCFVSGLLEVKLDSAMYQRSFLTCRCSDK
jgi:hypothetical protein